MEIEKLELHKLKFPIGRFKANNELNEENFQTSIATIRNFPSKINAICSDLNEEQIDWRYRPKGWNIRQVVHHCADSHMNGFTRTKLTLTEDKPIVKPYAEHLWAELRDYQLNIGIGLQMISNVHLKWALLFENMTGEQFERTYIHPEDRHEYSLAEQCGLYAWHCNHHFAHIEQALQAKGKYN